MQDALNKTKSIKSIDIKKWQAIIAEWEKSKESQKKFCHRLGLNLNTFSYVRQKLFTTKKGEIKNFIPVEITKMDNKEINSAETIILENSKGIKLHMPLLIPAEKLLELLRLAGW